MDSAPHPKATAILPMDLGPAAAFDQSVFPLAYSHTDGNLNKGVVLIRATLDEMRKIQQLGIDLNDNQDFIFNTRVELEELKARRTKLQDSKTFNPFKALLNYRAARLFHAATKALFLQTKRTSESIHRKAGTPNVVPSTQVQMIDGSLVPPDAVIRGIAIELPGEYDDIAKQTIDGATTTIITTDPFQDNSRIPQLGEDEHAISLLTAESQGEDESADSGTSVTSGDLQRSPPTSFVQNHYHFYNSIVATKSNVTTPTLNQGLHLPGPTQQTTP